MAGLFKMLHVTLNCSSRLSPGGPGYSVVSVNVMQQQLDRDQFSVINGLLTL